MNIQPIGVSNQVNSNKQKVDFGNYQSSITKKVIKAEIASIDEAYNLGLSKGFFKNGINSATTKLWKTLQSLKKTYEKDKAVDVKSFIEDEHIWVKVNPSNLVRSKQPLSGFGQGNFGIFNGDLIADSQNLKESVDAHAKRIKQTIHNSLF